MRHNVEAARDAGVNLGFLSGNVCYWQIRLQANETSPQQITRNVLARFTQTSRRRSVRH